MKRLAVLLICAVMLFTVSACAQNDKTFTVSYADNGQIYEIEVKRNNLYSIEEIPFKQGYEFLGLFDKEEGGNIYIDKNGTSINKFKLNKDLTLYPRFAPKTYTFILDYCGGTTASCTDSIAVEYGSELTDIPLDATLENYVFNGWFTEIDGNGERISDANGILSEKKTVDEHNYTLTDDGKIYLFAHYTLNSYKVTFCFDDEEQTKIEKYADYDSLIEDIAPVKNVFGFYVLNWSTEKGDGQMNNAVYKVTGEMTLYACKYGCGIIFESGNGQKFPTLIAEIGGEISLPVPEREGYCFDGWHTESGEKFSYTVMPPESLTLKAKWLPNPVITLNENHGASVDDISAKAGSAITLPETSRSGYTFAGWYTETGEKFTDSVMPEKDITLTARWYKNQSVAFSITDGEKSVNSSHTGIIFTVDCSQFFDENTSTEISVKVSYNVKIVNYWFPAEKPTYFVFAFHSKNEVNSAYEIGNAICRWSGEYGYCSASFDSVLKGNKIYIAADSNTWAWGYKISNFKITLDFIDNKLI